MKQILQLGILTLFTAFSCNKISSLQESQQLEEQTQQEIVLEKYHNLPDVCDESSGLEYINDMIVTMNDSGGNPELYVMEKNGRLFNTLRIKDVKNKDWESLATDGEHFYIADFGNNRGNRTNLKVYQFDANELTAKKVDLSKKIKFEYVNQTNFEDQNRAHSFDAEAMLVVGNEIIIFSKDWATRKTQVYHLQIQADKKQALQPTEIMNIGALITGADYLPEQKRLVLCGYENFINYVWIFENSTPEQFLTKNFKRIELDGLEDAQVEGITFMEDRKILISTEKTKLFDQQMWTLTF